ncbi:MAG: 30S ribosomal protein S8 [Caldiserica bacterium]|nr:MAG: 30S ribosomal protein S8 [Caldisericota bacterium]
MYSDPIADFLIRLKNASMVKKEVVEVPASRMKEDILKILQREGFIKEYSKIEDGRQGILKVYLKYKDGMPTLRGVKRVSKPGRRIYVKKDEIPKVLRGTGIAIISTSKGIMTDEEARKNMIGGEVICYVW